MEKRIKAGLTPFGKKVKKRLIDLGMTQVELAKEVGITDKYLYKILHKVSISGKYVTKFTS